MAGIFHREEIGKDIFFNSVREEKFTSNRITVCMVTPLNENEASDNALAAFILRKGCKAYSDFTLLNKKLARLYGAVLDGDVTKYGALQVMHVSIQAIDDRFALDNDEMVKEAATLLMSVVLEPNLSSDGFFPQKDFDLEKQYLIDTIESELNDKRIYAIKRCSEMLFEGESFGIRSYGNIENARAITRQSVTNAWRKLLETGRIEVMFTGMGEPTPAKQIIKEAFANVKRTPATYTLPEIKGKAEKLKEKEETMDVAQGKLVMGYRCGAPANKSEIDAMRVMCALFGGTEFSKLFANVREKLSLCYYCSSHYDKATGVMMVDSGVEACNKEKAQAEIINQLELMAKGDITEKELLSTILILKNALQTVGDMLGSIEGWYLTRILDGEVYTPEEDAKAIEKVSIKDIMNAAKKVELEAVYFLKGKEETDNG